MTIQGKNDIRCPVCRAEFNQASLSGLHSGSRCPHCHTSIPAIQIRHDGYIRMNWYELRVLTVYAQRWAMQLDTKNKGNLDAIKVLENILTMLEQYRPRDAQSHILMAHELAGMMQKTNRRRGAVPSPYFKRPPHV